MIRLRFIHEFCAAKKYTGQPVQYAQQKYDGHRITALKQPPGSPTPLVLYTRSQTDLYKPMYARALSDGIWPWIVELLDIPSNTSVDGELWFPGKPASYIKTAIKEGNPGLRFSAFAIPWLSGQRRYTDPLEWAMEQCSLFGIDFIPFMKFPKPVPVDADAMTKKIRPETEGWVLKKHHYSGWYKLKRIHTIDLIVTGFEPGNGKYEGMMGSIRCGAFDQYGKIQDICFCSGMTDEQRLEFSENDIGRTCEVQFQEVASLGRLRHPIFVRWRDDEKEPFECTLAQEPELLQYWVKR